MNDLKMKDSLKTVQSHWNDALYSQSKRYDLDKICSEYSKKFMDQYVDTAEFNYNPAHTPFENCLLLKLKNNNSSWVDYYKNLAVKISNKAVSFIEYSNEKYKDDKPKQLYNSSRVLPAYAILASINHIDQPRVPDKDIILNAIKPFQERLSSAKGRIPFDEKEKCILASVLALLAGETLLAAEFLSYCKSLKEVKHHYKVLNQVVNELGNDKEISDNNSVITAFFDLFNAYRLPVVSEKSKALGEYAITDNLVSNYLFAWLYLRFFEGKLEVTWDEMRIVMMG